MAEGINGMWPRLLMLLIKYVGPIVADHLLTFVLEKLKEGETEHLGVLGRFLANEAKRDIRAETIRNAINKITK